MSSKVKLAVKKEPGYIPGSGFHYMLHPIQMESDRDAAIWKTMGYEIIEVDADLAKRLLEQGRLALGHQLEIAYITEKQLAQAASA